MKNYSRTHDEARAKASASSLHEPGYALPTVGGRRVRTSNAEFERKCLVMLGEEQKKPSPDSALVDLLCEAVRLAREYSDAMNDSRVPSEGWSGAKAPNAPSSPTRLGDNQKPK